MFFVEDFNFFRIDFHRSRKARDTLIGQKYNRSIVTDRYSAYSDLKAPHQYCLAHLKRNFKKFAEGKGQPKQIAQHLIYELNQVFHIWRLYQGNNLRRNQLKSR